MGKNNSENKADFMKIALDESFDGIQIVDQKGYTLYINKACERIEGLTQEDIGDKTVAECVTAGLFDNPVTPVVVKEKKVITRKQTAKNGKEMLVTGTPIFEKGEVVGVVVNTRDLSELSMLQRQVMYQEQLLESYQTEIAKLEMNRQIKDKLFSHSKRMLSALAQIINVASSDSNVLLEGESGTGKTMLAQVMHDSSDRKNAPFIKVDCGTIPDTLFESELFGYEPGAFTGARKKGKTGLIELANKGTLFLDEIGEVPLAIQPKLLRFMQEKTIYKVGGEQPIRVDARIITATNRDLMQMVIDGTFREDLYYRVNVVPVMIPALRERKEDIVYLAYSFLDEINKKYGTKKTLSSEVTKRLSKYEWPGNIRELENLIERVVVTSSADTIMLSDLPDEMVRDDSYERVSTNDSLKDIMQKYEKKVLLQYVSEGYSAREISEQLKIDVTNVRRKLHKYHIEF